MSEHKIRISADSGQAESAINSLSGKIDNFASGIINSLVPAMTALQAGEKVVSTLKKAFSDVLSESKKLINESRKFNVPVEELIKMKAACDELGIASGSLVRAFKGLGKGITEAIQKPHSEKGLMLRMAGLSDSDLVEMENNKDIAMKKIQSLYQGFSSEAEKEDFGRKIFGGGFDQIKAYLDSTIPALEQASVFAAQHTQESATAGTALTNAFDDMGEVLKNLAIEFLPEALTIFSKIEMIVIGISRYISKWWRNMPENADELKEFNEKQDKKIEETKRIIEEDKKRKIPSIHSEIGSGMRTGQVILYNPVEKLKELEREKEEKNLAYDESVKRREARDRLYADQDRKIAIQIKKANDLRSVQMGVYDNKGIKSINDIAKMEEDKIKKDFDIIKSAKDRVTKITEDIEREKKSGNMNAVSALENLLKKETHFAKDAVDSWLLLSRGFQERFGHKTSYDVSESPTLFNKKQFEKSEKKRFDKEDDARKLQLDALSGRQKEEKMVEQIRDMEDEYYFIKEAGVDTDYFRLELLEKEISKQKDKLTILKRQNDETESQNNLKEKERNTEFSKKFEEELYKQKYEKMQKLGYSSMAIAKEKFDDDVRRLKDFEDAASEAREKANKNKNLKEQARLDADASKALGAVSTQWSKVQSEATNLMTPKIIGQAVSHAASIGGGGGAISGMALVDISKEQLSSIKSIEKMLMQLSGIDVRGTSLTGQLKYPLARPSNK